MTASFRNFKTLLVALSLIATATTGAHAADSLSIDFESYALGGLPGANTAGDTRTAGNDTTWWVPSNAATSATVAPGVGLGGSQGLIISNNNSGNDGTIDNVKSPRLAESAGETGTNSGVGGTAATEKTFASSYSFRTAMTSPVDGYQFASEIYGPDRNTYLLFSLESFYGETSLTAYLADYNDPSNQGQFLTIASNIAFGEYYRVETNVNFVDGSANDAVSVRIFDDTNTLVGSTLGGTWEEGQRVQGFNGGNIFSVDSVQFQARDDQASPARVTGDIAFVDNLSYAVVPEPATLALAGAASLALVAVGRRRSAR